MESVPLTDELRQQFYSFMDSDPRLTSLNTVKSYKFVADKVFKNYDVISKETTRAIIKRYGKKTKAKAMFGKLNDFFLEYDIDYIIRFIKTKKEPRKIPDILSKDKLKEVLDSMPKDFSIMLSCMYNIGAGLRISELINLEWDDISWDQLTLDNPIIDVKIKNSKRGKSRVVPMPKESAISLIEYATEKKCIGSEGLPAGGRIFNFGEEDYKKDLKIVDRKEWEWDYVRHSYNWIMYNLFLKYFKPITGKNITPHSLRHSRATELVSVHKMPIEKLKDWLGHDDISTTMIYLHLGSKDDKELMSRIGGV